MRERSSGGRLPRRHAGRAGSRAAREDAEVVGYGRPQRVVRVCLVNGLGLCCTPLDEEA